MFDNLWRLLRQDELVQTLKEELEKVRIEKTQLQDTLHHVLRIHLIPKDLEEMRTIPSQQPIQIPRRGFHSALTELQKRSFDEATRKRIEQEEQKIADISNDDLPEEKAF